MRQLSRIPSRAAWMPIFTNRSWGQRVVEVPRPCLVGIVLADNRGGLLVGDVDADPLEPEHVVAAAAVAEPRGPLLDYLGETAIVDRSAGHAQREVRAHLEVAVFVDPPVGIEDRRGEAVPLVDAGGARRRVRRRAEPASGHPILEGDARGAAKQCVLDDRRIGAIEEDPGRLAVAFAQDLDVVRRLRVRPDAPRARAPWCWRC